MHIHSTSTAILKYILCLYIVVLATACTNTEKSDKFRIYFRGEDRHKEQIFTLADLSQGYVDATQQGEVLDSDICYDLYYHKGVYYDIDRPDKIKKYILKNGRPALESSCEIAQMTEIETHTWINDTILAVIGLDSKHRNPVYAFIDTKEFKVKQYGEIPIPDDNSYQRTSIGFAAVAGDVMYITYVYHQLSADSYTTSEAINLITLDYPQMTVRHNSSNNRSTYEMKNGRHQPTMAIGADKKFYFLTNTSSGFGQMEHIPSGVLRANMKEENLDDHYFVNITDTLKGCYPTAIWHVWNDIFLLKCERTDLMSSWEDYLEERVFEYYALNVRNNSLTKLDLPLDTPWYTNNVLVDNDVAYIANNAEDGYTFWLFNPKDNSLKKGLKLDPSVKRIFSIDLN